jgi:tetratricopeptide (TPR) repeat protein
MFINKPEFIILCLGILAALSGFQSFNEVRAKARFFQILFALGLLTQIATQFIQYSNAVSNRKREERISAFSLFAYNRKDIALLKRISKNNPYLIGYRLWQDSKFSDAATYFREAINKDLFVAPSHYMLAQIKRRSTDWTEARDHLDEAIKYDNEYAAAYYARAMIAMKSNEHARALKDLENAVKYDAGQCYDITNEQEVSRLWKAISKDSMFKQLQADCSAKYDIRQNQASKIKLNRR